MNQEGGRRQSVADAYLKPILDRPNLSVQTGALVTHVRFKRTRAVGVEYESSGEPVLADVGVTPSSW